MSVPKATLGSGACLLNADRQTDRHRQTDRQTGFLVGSEGNVRHWSLLARRRFRPSVPWRFAVSESPARTSLLFRNRPLELRCGAVLRAWELQFGAGFLSVQKICPGVFVS